MHKSTNDPPEKQLLVPRDSSKQQQKTVTYFGGQLSPEEFEQKPESQTDFQEDSSSDDSLEEPYVHNFYHDKYKERMKARTGKETWKLDLKRFEFAFASLSTFGWFEEPGFCKRIKSSFRAMGEDAFVLQLAKEEIEQMYNLTLRISADSISLSMRSLFAMLSTKFESCSDMADGVVFYLEDKLMLDLEVISSTRVRDLQSFCKGILDSFSNITSTSMSDQMGHATRVKLEVNGETRQVLCS